MTLTDEVIQILEKNRTRPLDALNEVSKYLADLVRPGGRYDPLKSVEEWKEGRDGYHAAHNWFKEKKYYFASEKLLIKWWNQLGIFQRKHKKRIYRAEAAYLLSDLYWEMEDIGMALRWAMLMQADDILGAHQEGGGAGRQTLTTKYGLSINALDKLNRIANECLNEVMNDWSKPSGFAEEVLCRFARGKASYALAYTTSVREFPVSPGYLKSLIERVKTAKESNKKGKALEDLAFYLLLLLPGCIPHQNVLSEQKIYETDVLVHNLSQTPTVVTELLGRQFLIECKNRKEKTSVSDIGYFLYRMKLMHTKFGIIFTREGITGKTTNEAGTELIRRAFHEDDLICVIMDDHDLVKLASKEPQSFWWMLLDKIEALRFGKPVKKVDA